MIELTIPISEEKILSLHAGDAVAISGVGTTGRDAAHKYLVERLIEGKRPLSAEDQRIYDELKKIYRGGAIYHSGPIVRNADGRWSIVSSGPTTSIRDEIYEDKVIAHFGLRVVIGKGGMGPRTLAACKAYKAVYVHGIGGAGVTNALAMVEVLDVFKRNGVNLTFITSRPSKRRNWEYYFFADAEGHVEDEAMSKALPAVKEHCLELHVLGSFPKAIDVE